MFHVISIHLRPARIFARARLLLAIHHAANFVKVLRRDHPKLPQVLPQVVDSMIFYPLKMGNSTSKVMGI